MGVIINNKNQLLTTCAFIVRSFSLIYAVKIFSWSKERKTTLETTFLQKKTTLLQYVLIFENQYYTLSLKNSSWECVSVIKKIYKFLIPLRGFDDYFYAPHSRRICLPPCEERTTFKKRKTCQKFLTGLSFYEFFREQGDIAQKVKPKFLKNK